MRGLTHPRKDELAPLDIWHRRFEAHPAGIDLLPTSRSAAEAEISEGFAAKFVLALLRQRRRRGISCLSAMRLHDGSFRDWIVARAEKLGLSPKTIKKIGGVFRRPPGQRVYDVYLNNPELQITYPLGLLPLGQAHFVSWMRSHGRTDFQLTNEQMLWFLYQSAEEWQRGIVLTYLIRPSWQEEFPRALTEDGWRPFLRALRKAYGRYFSARLVTRRPPRVLPLADQQTLPIAYDRSLQEKTGRVEGANVISHFCNPSGIQQAALWTKAALERAGLQTSCRDVPVPRHTTPTNRADWLGLEVYPFTILTQAATPYFASGYERAGLFRREDIYRIAYWAWELERVPNEWIEVAAFVNEIWAPTPFIEQAMRAAMPRPVYGMLPGVEIGTVESVSREQFEIPPDHCVFLFMFDLHSQINRKNPGGAVRAFRSAFRRDDAATLVIKATGGDFFKKDFRALEEICRGENIVLVHEVMSRERAYGMLEMCDCFVSLHRSEGFGLGLAEAMLLAKPAIATGYSGNLAFMNRENSMLVDYVMVEIEEDRPIYTKGNRWAEPSVEHAAAYMREVYEHREEATARANRVRPEIERLLSLEAAGQRMRTRLEEIARIADRQAATTKDQRE